MGDNDRHHQQHHATSSGSIVSDNKDAKRDGTQLLTSVNTLIQDFRKHSFRSKSYSASGRCFILLVDLLDKYYQSNATRESVGDATSSTVSSSAYHDVKVILAVKKCIISFLLSFRANSLGQVTATDDSGDDDEKKPCVEFSPYCILASFLETQPQTGNQTVSFRSTTGSLAGGTVSSPPSPPHNSSSFMTASGQSYCSMNLTDMFAVLLKVLEQESSWDLVKLVINGLTKIISQNPSMITATKSSDCYRRHLSIANDIAFTVCKIIKTEDPSKRFPEDFQTTSGMLTTPGGTKKHKGDFDCLVYPLLESLIVYGKLLEGSIQTMMVEVFRDGLKNRHYVKNAVHALTCCLMEMQDQKVIKILPDILLKISQISATKAMAGPKMSFLSTLILFPKLYSSWIDDQYLCIFGIAMPYTNYSKSVTCDICLPLLCTNLFFYFLYSRPSIDQRFDEFTVALAHRVIALWFLNCKVHLRAGLSRFIRKNLLQNIHSIAVEDDIRDRAQSCGQQPRR